MKDLVKVSRALSLFTGLYYKSTINHARAFFEIAALNDRVIYTKDLPELLDMTQTTVNRTIRQMADRNYIHDVGWGVLKIHIDGEDERQRIVELTPKGKKLALQMMEMIYGESA